MSKIRKFLDNRLLSSIQDLMNQPLGWGKRPRIDGKEKMEKNHKVKHHTVTTCSFTKFCFPHLVKWPSGIREKSRKSINLSMNKNLGNGTFKNYHVEKKDYLAVEILEQWFIKLLLLKVPIFQPSCKIGNQRGKYC